MEAVTHSDGTSFRFEQGRRFQNESHVAYVLPNDFNGKKQPYHQYMRPGVNLILSIVRTGSIVSATFNVSLYFTMVSRTKRKLYALIAYTF